MNNVSSRSSWKSEKYEASTKLLSQNSKNISDGRVRRMTLLAWLKLPLPIEMIASSGHSAISKAPRLLPVFIKQFESTFTNFKSGLFLMTSEVHCFKLLLSIESDFSLGNPSNVNENSVLLDPQFDWMWIRVKYFFITGSTAVLGFTTMLNSKLGSIM